MKNLVFFGDSITAGFGLDDPNDAFPGQIQREIEAAHLDYRVTNAGLSGETSAGGLKRLEWLLKETLDVFVLELGANDGLRGLPPETTLSNLDCILTKVRENNLDASLLIAGMYVPENMGAAYTSAFQRIFPDLAQRHGATLIPFLLEGVAGHAELTQPDGIHPTVAGHRRIAELVWKHLRPALQ